MTRATSARLAGFTYLFYIAVALPATILFNRAAGGDGVAAKLAGLGVAASLLLLAGLPLQLVGFLTGPVAMLMWLPAVAAEPAARACGGW